MSPISWKIRARSPFVRSPRRPSASSPSSGSCASSWASLGASRSSAMSADGSRLSLRVAEIDRARSEAARLDQVQRQADVRREERRPGTDRNRMDDKPVLVDEAGPDELRGDRRPGDVDVAVELVAQSGVDLADVAADDAAVPLDLLERRGEHDLR